MQDLNEQQFLWLFSDKKGYLFAYFPYSNDCNVNSPIMHFEMNLIDAVICCNNNAEQKHVNIKNTCSRAKKCDHKLKDIEFHLNDDKVC